MPPRKNAAQAVKIIERPKRLRRKNPITTETPVAPVEAPSMPSITIDPITNQITINSSINTTLLNNEQEIDALETESDCPPPKPVKRPYKKKALNTKVRLKAKLNKKVSSKNIINGSPSSADLEDCEGLENEAPKKIQQKPSKGRVPARKKATNIKNGIKPRIKKGLAVTEDLAEVRSSAVPKLPKMPKAARGTAAAAKKQKLEDIKKLKEHIDAIRKQEKADLKIKLANEVIRSAFQKKPQIVKRTVVRPRKQGKSHGKVLDSDLDSIDTPVSKRKVLKRVYSKRKAPTDIRDIDVPSVLPPLTMTVTNKAIQKQEESPKKRRRLTLKRKHPVQVTEATVIKKPQINEDKVVITVPAESSQPKTNSCRRNSANSLSTCYSWTKDISSSSSTTCITVQSNDFVLIDNKFPVVKLVNVDHKLKDSNDNIFEESFDSQRDESINTSISDVNITNTLNLSTSSLTSVENSQNTTRNAMVRLRRRLEESTSIMKNFDLEMTQWIGYDNVNIDDSTNKCHDRIYELLTDECEVFRYAKEIKRLSGYVSPVEEEPDPTENETGSDNDIERDKSDRISTPEPNENVDRKSFEKDFVDNEDDDALSLFAESISGLESSRKNSSIVSQSNPEEETVARPRREAIVLNDRTITDIGKDSEIANVCTKQAANVCTKQTADSSSANRISDSVLSVPPPKNQPLSHSFSDVFDRNVNRFGDYQNDSDVSENVDTVPVSERQFDDDIRTPIENSNEFQTDSIQFNSPQYTGFSVPHSEPSFSHNNSAYDNHNLDSLDTVSAENSSFSSPECRQVKPQAGLFKRVCTFNLASKCKKPVCPYDHIQIPINAVPPRLRSMSEDTFLKDLAYLKSWQMLWPRYGVCFIEECSRRELTRPLLETVKHFLQNVKVPTKTYIDLFTEVSEVALMHLNKVDINSVRDILRVKIWRDLCLCDYFMKVISETQNFSRFKNVFIKLTMFVGGIGRSFQLPVATQVLERLCILPYDEALANALMEIIKKTAPRVFELPMMKLFEGQLARNNARLLEELVEARRAAGYGQPQSQVQSSPVARADSPDTTNVDFVNHTVEPVIRRTIINRTISTGDTPSGLNVTPGRVNVTPSGLNVTPGRVNVTPSGLNVTPGRVNVTPSGLNVTLGRVNGTPGGIRFPGGVIRTARAEAAGGARWRPLAEQGWRKFPPSKLGFNRPGFPSRRYLGHLANYRYKPPPDGY